MGTSLCAKHDFRNDLINTCPSKILEGYRGKCLNLTSAQFVCLGQGASCSCPHGSEDVGHNSRGTWTSWPWKLNWDEEWMHRMCR